jgi:hypothetical protein
MRIGADGSVAARRTASATSCACVTGDDVSAKCAKTFFARFSRAVGVAPMEYLLTWRMALAKGLLRRNEGRMAEIAELARPDRRIYRDGEWLHVAVLEGRVQVQVEGEEIQASSPAS